MEALLSVHEISKGFDRGPLFEGLSFGLFPGECVALIGPNGAGKSSLLKILSGLDQPDGGTVSCKRNLRRSSVAQHVGPFGQGISVLDLALEAAGAAAAESDPEWRAKKALSDAGFRDFSVSAAQLSGGWQKRLALALALAAEPELIFLDEPTNHLDIPSQYWLEELIQGAEFTSVIATHDRYFLQNTATAVCEINPALPAGYFFTRGPYQEFLAAREEFLRSVENRKAALASIVRREREWLSRGPKARGTKAKARSDQAYSYMAELALIRSLGQKRGVQELEFSSGTKRSKELFALSDVSVTMGERTLIDNLSCKLGPGSAVGVLGPNGCGKTTLLRLFTGELLPASGTLARSNHLKTAYFDQHRAALDETLSLRRALAPDSDSIVYRNSLQHVVTWARRFGFKTEQLDTPVGALSGGERARVQLAELLRNDADVLLLDEPSNDLDIPTLEHLEQALREFPGLIVLISHDRYLLNRVCTGFIGFDGQGGCDLYASFEQWETAYRAAEKEARTAQAQKNSEKREAKRSAGPKKLSYMEQREYDSIEQRILESETRLGELEAQLGIPEVQCDAVRLTDLCKEIESARQEVAERYQRWEELESKRGSSS